MFCSLELLLLVSCVTEILLLTCVPFDGRPTLSLLWCMAAIPEPDQSQQSDVIVPRKCRLKSRRRKRGRTRRRPKNIRSGKKAGFASQDNTKKPGAPLAEDDGGGDDGDARSHAATRGWRHEAETAPVLPDPGTSTTVVLLLELLLLAFLQVRGTHLCTLRKVPSPIVTSCIPLIHGALILIKHPLEFEKTCPSAQQSPARTSATPSSSSPVNKGNRVEKTGGNLKPRKTKKNNNDAGPVVDAKNQDVKGANKGRSMACHFFKFDPETHRGCGTLTHSNYAAVAQHLTRSPSHCLGNIYCANCWRVWDPRYRNSERDYNEHIDAGDCIAQLGPERLYPWEEALLRRGAPRGCSDEDKWYWVWDTFFPDHPRPASPYNESTIDEIFSNLRRQGPANEAATLGLEALVTEQRFFLPDILGLLQSSYTNVPRPLRLYYGTHETIPLTASEPIPHEAPMLPSNSAVVSPQPQVQTQPPPQQVPAPIVAMDPILEATDPAYPARFESMSPASDPDIPSQETDRFLHETTIGVFDPEDLDTEQLQGAS